VPHLPPLGISSKRTVFSYKTADLSRPASVAGYNMGWSLTDGFHAGGLGLRYHALDIKEEGRRRRRG
jgi:hypothetical protein